jgi:hypothetical protein
MSIEAYANLTSVTQGNSITFYLPPNSNYDIKITKAWDDITPVWEDTGSTSNNYSTNSNYYIIGCGWDEGYTWEVPSNIQSGPYIASFTDHASIEESNPNQVLFFVKPSNPGVNASILFMSAVNTAQAYNGAGGKSLYDHNSNGQRSYKVSFNRPMLSNDFFRWELSFIKWLFDQDYSVEFCTNVDIHSASDSNFLNNYKLLLSVGHDEYWSWEMRDNVENFVSQGGNVAFFTANTCWWQVRYEPQEDIDNRLLVCYKEQYDDVTHTYNPNEDPYLELSYPDIRKTTSNWRRPPADRPENDMTGEGFIFGAFNPEPKPDAEYEVILNKHWLFKGTGLVYQNTFGLYTESIEYQTIGYETDGVEFTSSDPLFPLVTGAENIPKDFMILASSHLTGWEQSGWAIMGIFRKPGGGFVFNGGSTDWSVGLLPYLNEDVWTPHCEITKNVLDILGNDFEPQAFILDNADFEDWDGNNPISWYSEGNGTITEATGYSEEGSSIKIEASGSNGMWVSQNYIPCRTNRRYQVKCYAKPDDSYSEGDITIRLQTTDNYSDFAVATYPGDTTNWQLIENPSTDGVINDSEDRVRPVRVKIQVATGVTAYFDKVVVEEV